MARPSSTLSLTDEKIKIFWNNLNFFWPSEQRIWKKANASLSSFMSLLRAVWCLKFLSEKLQTNIEHFIKKKLCKTCNGCEYSNENAVSPKPCNKSLFRDCQRCQLNHASLRLSPTKLPRKTLSNKKYANWNFLSFFLNHLNVQILHSYRRHTNICIWLRQ